MNHNFIDSWVGDILSNENLLTKLSDQPYWSLLNSEEREKASRFARPNLQNKYVKTRGALRTILASYLKINAQNIEFKLGEYGKPYLPDNSIHFNLSHTENKFVVVVSNEPLGVDIEHIKKRQGLAGLVDKCFSEIEQTHWNNVSKQEKTALFYHFWVRKEAFVKAVGRGIALGLNECVVNPKQMNQFLSIPHEYNFASDWKILDMKIEKMKCAIVTKDKDYKIRHLQFP